MEACRYERLDETAFHRTLPNGLQVTVVPRPGFSRKIAYFVTDFGAMHRDFTFEGQTWHTPAGVAHYLEHKMFDLPGRDVSGEFARMGASTNAFTSYDMTAYYFACTQHFPECLQLLLEFVSTPYFTQETVEKERGIIDQEIGMNLDAPDSEVFEQLVRAAYREHPIHTPILGTRESIRQITPEILRLCHRAFYNPGNMLLCVVGDVDPEQVVELARRVLGDEKRETARKLTPWQEPLTCDTPFVSKKMDVAMPTFTMAFKTRPLEKGAEGIRREMAADLAAEALFGESSQLYLSLYEQGIIDSAFGGGFETIDGCAMMLVSGDSDHPEQVRDALIARAEEIGREGIPEESFLRMKRSALGRRIRELDSFDATCFRLCAYQLSGFDYFRFPEIYETITAGEVRALLAEMIRRDNCCLSVIYELEDEL